MIDIASASFINNLLGRCQYLTYLIFRDLATFHLKAGVILDEELAKWFRFHALPYLLSGILVNTLRLLQSVEHTASGECLLAFSHSIQLLLTAAFPER